MSPVSEKSTVFFGFLKPQYLKSMFQRMKVENASMRRRFAIYVLLQICAIIAVVLLLLNLLGILNPVSGKLEQRLQYQLDNSCAAMSLEMENLASYAMVFSDQMSVLLKSNLEDLSLSPADLTDNPDALTHLQSDAYLTVYNNMRIARCSGAFYFLDASVNSRLEQSHYNGLYLKVTSLFSDNTIHSKASLFRGSASVARENEINLHSTWQNELTAEAFPELYQMINQLADGWSAPFVLTTAQRLPDTWERARFLCVPIWDEQQRPVGICGFEISDLFFKLSHRTVLADETYMVCALLDRTADGYTGQISGNQSGYTPPVEELFYLEDGKPFTLIHCGTLTFYGKAREITIGETVRTLVIMLPEAQYQRYVRLGTVNNLLFLLGITVAAVLSSLWLSKKYVSPIVDGLQQAMSVNPTEVQSTVPEINDLCLYLAEQDRQHEQSLETLEQQYEQAQREYAAAQADYTRAQAELEEAKNKLELLARSRKNEVDSGALETFKAGLQKLTRSERDIFHLYRLGKTTKEVLEITGIKESTLKFHNHNILGKLGVSSRKEMLRYAACINWDTMTPSKAHPLAPENHTNIPTEP